MSEERSDVTEAESQVMKVLWDHGGGTVRDIQSRLNTSGVEWKRSTVITLLQRLEKKGFVASNRSRFAFVFSPAVSRNQYLQQRIGDLAEEFYGGQPAPLILAFAQQHTFTEEELRQFQIMIEDSLPGTKPGKSKKSTSRKARKRHD